MLPQNRFIRLARKSQLPDRDSSLYNLALRQRHAAIIGICALIDSFPYTIERWMPELLTTVMLEHAQDPVCLRLTLVIVTVDCNVIPTDSRIDDYTQMCK